MSDWINVLLDHAVEFRGELVWTVDALNEALPDSDKKRWYHAIHRDPTLDAGIDFEVLRSSGLIDFREQNPDSVNPKAPHIWIAKRDAVARLVDAHVPEGFGTTPAPEPLDCELDVTGHGHPWLQPEARTTQPDATRKAEPIGLTDIKRDAQALADKCKRERQALIVHREKVLDAVADLNEQINWLRTVELAAAQ